METDNKTIFEKLLENPDVQKVLSELSDEDRGLLVESIRKFTEQAEKSIIKPLEQWKETLEQTKVTKP